MILLLILGDAENFAPGRDYSKGFNYRRFWMRGSRPAKIYLQVIGHQAYWTMVNGGLAMLPLLGIAAIVFHVKKRRLDF